MVDSPAHQGDFVIDVLEQIHVKDVMDEKRKMDLVPERKTLREVLRLAAISNNTYFPVVNDENRLVGIFSLRDLRSVFGSKGEGAIILAADLATSPVLTVNPKDDLHTALRRFTQKNIDEIPIVDPVESGKILGMLSRKHLIAAYHDRVTELQHAGDAPESDY
jgi:CIC family chloride channel protein